MLSTEDREAIDGLFDRIEQAAARSLPRDPDAEVLIQRHLRNAPASPYYMAQTILVQEQALAQAQQRLTELEAQISNRPASGGFLGGLFGNPAPQPSRQPARRNGPWDNNPGYKTSRNGGGFLAGAAQTALGVTGGMLLGSALAGLFTGEANAAQDNADSGDDADANDGGFDGGGDDGGFDVGGDF